jgi:hypothetical protein
MTNVDHRRHRRETDLPAFVIRESRMKQHSLKPQDVVVLVKLLTYTGAHPSIAQMGVDLSISASEVHTALRRLAEARLTVAARGDNRPVFRAAEEFLIHGVKYAFPARRGEVTRGVPTSYAAPPLNATILPGDLLQVWPHPEGAVRGGSLAPLYPSVPAAALRDAVLHEFLALIDALRDGRARERRLAEEALRARLRRQAEARFAFRVE